MIGRELQNKVLSLRARENIRLVELLMESLDKPENSRCK